jgi:hypothetical protein
VWRWIGPPAGTSTAWARPGAKVYQMGFLSGRSAAASRSFVEQFQHRLREFGYAKSYHIIIEYRRAEGQPSDIPQLAIDLVFIKRKTKATPQ